MSKDAAADVSVIIVNYGTAGLALEAVASVLAHPERVRDIHVVDNASPGGDAAVLAREIAARGWQDRVTLHAETVNHGFGRGNNLVIETLARSEDPPAKVFLLNPDAQLANAAVAIQAEFLDTHPEVGAAGARTERPDGSPGASAFRFPGLVSTFSGALSFGPVSRLLARWQVPLPAGIPTSRVDWVEGSALMLRMEAIRSVGFFDPEYFLYYEEVDLMNALARKGWQTWHVAEARVIHVGGAATGVQAARRARRRLPSYWYHSWQHYMHKNHGRAAALVACVLWYGGAGMNAILSLLRGKPPAAPAHLAGDLWTHGVRPLIGLPPRGTPGAHG